MADDGLPKTADEQFGNAPRPREETRGAQKEDVATEGFAKEDIAPVAREAAALSGLQDAIRSVFVARTTASGEALAADFSNMQTADNGKVVRGAYLAHIADIDAAIAAGGDLSGGNVLREAYLAHAAVVREQGQRSRPKRSATARRKATAKLPGRKSAKKAPKKSAKQPAGRKAKAKAPAALRRQPKAKKSIAASARPAPHMGRSRAAAPRARRAKRPRR